MKFDLNLTITGIIALCAIVSPIITSIIDNNYKIKIKKMDNYELEKRKVLEEFINSTIECITTTDDCNPKSVDPTLECLKRYYNASKKLLLYFPEIDIKKIKLLDNQITSGRKECIDSFSQDIIQNLSKYISKQ